MEPCSLGAVGVPLPPFFCPASWRELRELRVLAVSVIPGGARLSQCSRRSPQRARKERRERSESTARAQPGSRCKGTVQPELLLLELLLELLLPCVASSRSLSRKRMHREKSCALDSALPLSILFPGSPTAHGAHQRSAARGLVQSAVKGWTSRQLSN